MDSEAFNWLPRFYSGIEYGKSAYPVGRPLHSLRDDSLHWIVEGRGYFENAEGRVEPIRAGDFFTTRQEVPHRFSADSGTVWTECWLVFDQDVRKKLLGPTEAPAPGVYRGLIAANLLDSWKRLYQLGARASEPIEQWWLVHQILFNFERVLEATRERRGGGRQPHERMVDAAIETMAGALDQPLFDVQAFARKAGVSYESFRKHFRLITGEPPAHYFLALKMRRAELLLLHPGRSIASIAHDLGYEDALYFSRVFRKFKGTAPSVFRNSVV